MPLVIAGRVRDVAHAAPLTGVTLTMKKGCPRLEIKPAGTIATLAVVLPYNPVDGDAFQLSTTKEITTITVTAPNSTTVANGVAILPANGTMQWRYNKGDATWDSV